MNRMLRFFIVACVLLFFPSKVEADELVEFFPRLVEALVKADHFIEANRKPPLDARQKSAVYEQQAKPSGEASIVIHAKGKTVMIQPDCDSGEKSRDPWKANVPAENQAQSGPVCIPGKFLGFWALADYQGVDARGRYWPACEILNIYSSSDGGYSLVNNMFPANGLPRTIPVQIVKAQEDVVIFRCPYNNNQITIQEFTLRSLPGNDEIRVTRRLHDRFSSDVTAEWFGRRSL